MTDTYTSSKIFFTLFDTKKKKFLYPNYGFSRDSYNKTPTYKLGSKEVADAMVLAKPGKNLIVKMVKVTTIEEIL